MEFFYLLITVVSLSRIAVHGRAMNISTSWFLPEEGFSVFYKFFDEKVTWEEAQTICTSHHSDLLLVQTNGQMDAIRAYLKEIDVVDNVWIGLQKESPEKPFTWTNGEKLLGEGYWIEPIPKSNEKLCAAIDPASDFRWNSFYCRGPQVASFVCQLPVPDWAKKENGCLIGSLPSLTVTLMPEAGVIQLLSDCGLDGTRRIACNEKSDHKEIIKRLSCDVDAFASTIFSKLTTADGVITNTHSSSESNHQTNSYQTTKSDHPLTRHRRSATVTSAVPQQETSPPTHKQSPNFPSHVFPHSPYLASERNAPSTQRPQPAATPSTKPNATAPLSNDTKAYKPLPVIILTGENINGTVPPGTSESPPIVLMIENKDLEGPFLFPLADDIIINNSSLSPVEIISVDLVEVDNITNNATNNQTTPVTPLDALMRLVRTDDNPKMTTKPTTEDTSKDFLNTVEGENKDSDVPQRPNRGRLFNHPSQPFFYPRFLNRVLG